MKQRMHQRGDFPTIKWLPTAIALAVTLLSSVTYSAEPIPIISNMEVSTNTVNLVFSNISTGGTYYIERVATLPSNTWAEVSSFEGDPGTTNWSDTVSDVAFYRLIRDPYHPNVGNSATFGDFGPLFHDVSGTAHLINNRTVELRDFNYDGEGLVIEIYLSPNATTFAPYVSISEDLVGTAYTNATVQFNIPEGTDLGTYTNISVWCVAAGVSFGTGTFQP